MHFQCDLKQPVNSAGFCKVATNLGKLFNSVVPAEVESRFTPASGGIKTALLQTTRVRNMYLFYFSCYLFSGLADISLLLTLKLSSYVCYNARVVLPLVESFSLLT